MAVLTEVAKGERASDADEIELFVGVVSFVSKNKEGKVTSAASSRRSSDGPEGLGSSAAAVDASKNDVSARAQRTLQKRARDVPPPKLRRNLGFALALGAAFASAAEHDEAIAAGVVDGAHGDLKCA